MSRQHRQEAGSTRHGRSFAKFGRSQKNAFLGRESRKFNKTPSKEGTKLEQNRIDMAVAIATYPFAYKNLQDALNAATAKEQQIALSLAEQQNAGGSISLNLRKEAESNPRIASLAMLILTLMIILAACAPIFTPEVTAAPPTLSSEITPIEEPTQINEVVSTEEPVQIDDNFSEVTGEITMTPEVEIPPTLESVEVPPTAEAEETPIPETGQLSYPSNFSEWLDIDDYEDDKLLIGGNAEEGITGLDPEGLAQAEIILRDQAREQGISVEEILVKVTASRYSVVIRDTEGVIWYAAGSDTQLPFTQLFPYGTTSRDQWTLMSNPLDNAENYQELVESENGLFFSIIEKNAAGEAVAWMDLATGKLIEVQKGVEWTTVENIEDCANNPLSVEDMEPGGRVDQYLAEIKPRLMEETSWDIIKDDIPFAHFGGAYTYWDGTEDDKVNFVNPELNPSIPDTNPFDRDIDAFGLYTADNGRRYCFVPLVIRDIDAPTETGHDIYIIKLLLPLQQDNGTPLSQFELDYMFENWNHRMNTAPIVLRKDEDPTFHHLERGQPGTEARILALTGLTTGKPVHGPLSQFKLMENFLFPTVAENLTNADGTPSNRYK